jgi:predicted NBD/HSP70 family sugar kinase
VGIGVPGLVTEDNETVFYGKILNFTGATRSQFARYIPYKTALYNDANAAAFGEFWVDGMRGNAFYISLSKYIGGAVMVNGRIIGGSHFHAGEVGHLTLHPGGRRCYCGQTGCVDPYLGSRVLSDLSNGSLNAFFELLKTGNQTAAAAWDAYLNDLALTVKNVQELFDGPVILGGYVAEYLEPWLPELRKRAAALNPFETDADYLAISKYKTWAIAAGAAVNFAAGFINAV